ncbi:MAG: hypothetical protein A4E64_00028 [Syntrophorhabdus sp. PtaU1.Bin058]|nr:MAG: hypothetical protein A4E64_00028 [Syntrophorhabdus sp. PtaU1.Bin058]
MHVTAELAGDPCRLFRFRHHKGFSQPCLCHALDEIAVYAGADTEGKDIGRIEVVAYQAEDIPLGIDKAVGYDYDAAGNALFSWKRKGPSQCSGKLGPPSSLLLCNDLHCPVDVFFCRRHRRPCHNAGSACKEHEIKPVVLSEITDKVLDERFGRIKGESVHGTGDIEDKDIFPGQYLRRFNTFGRLHHKEEEIFLLAFIEHEAAFDPLAGKPIPEDKIPVAAEVIRFCEGDPGNGSVFPLHIHGMRRAQYLLQWYPGRK